MQTRASVCAFNLCGSGSAVQHCIRGKMRRLAANVAVYDRAEQFPALALEALHLQLLDWEEVVRAGVDRDARQQHPEFQVFQARGLYHHVFAREVIAAVLEHLHQRLGD